MAINKKQEKACITKVVELGNSNDPVSVPRLIKALEYPSFHVQRLAISGLGKLANLADPKEVVPILITNLRNSHAQIRQYSIKALKAYGVHSINALDDLKDIANNSHEKDYNNKDAQQAIDIIEEAIAVKQNNSIQSCQKCSVIINGDEYARAQKAFQRNYCDKCFDEVYLARRNYDTNVELNKKIRAKDGTFVQSDGEKKICEWLTHNNIQYRYDERIRIIEGMAIRPDFYLPEFDIYIEYWGMDTIDYKIGMLKKQKLYQQEGKKLISLYPDDKNNLDVVMSKKINYLASIQEISDTSFGKVKEA